jgi:hypothetical protein
MSNIARIRTEQRARLFPPTDARAIVLQYLATAGPTRIDWRGRRTLARVLCLGANYELELAVFDLHRRGLVTLDDDFVALAQKRAVAA